MSLVDKLKKKSRVKWTTLRGEKIGLRILTRNEMKDYRARITAVDETEDVTRGIFEVFAEMILNEQSEQALTIDEMEEVLTDSELRELMTQFNKANGTDSGDSEKN